MKNKSLGILSIALIAGLGLVGCNKKSSLDIENMGSVIKTKQDVYAYGAFSATTLLANTGSETTTLANTTVTDEQLNKINQYIGMFEDLTSSEGFKQETVKNEDAAYASYETKMSVKAGDKNYVVYYNEAALDEKDEDEDEDEISTKLDGIMLMNDTEYTITGVKEIEEDEVEIEIVSKIDESNYVKVTQEIENDEQEFEYEVMKNGVVEYSSIEIEKENNEVEVELQFGKDEESATIYEFKQQVNEDNSTKMEIEVYKGEDNLIEKIKVNTYIDPETNQKINEYIFEDGTNKKLED